MRIAVYAGTFDPVTRGHLSVIARAASSFDSLVIAAADNPAKLPLFSPAERVALLRDCTADLANVDVLYTAGLVIELARERRARFLIRGVRGKTDIDGEISLANFNHQLAPEITTFFVPADPELSEVSSSRLKELALEGSDVSRFCMPNVAHALREKLHKEVVHGSV